LVVVQPVDERSRTMGASFIAIDHLCSPAPGDLVLVLREGNGVRQVLKDKSAPIRSAIVGWVDEVSS
jgi:ethanolamine utilization protein EutN